VTIVAGAFDGASRLARHRMVNVALAAELAGGVHARAIRAPSPAAAGGGLPRALIRDGGRPAAFSHVWEKVPRWGG
jgi:hypothetical protein